MARIRPLLTISAALALLASGDAAAQVPQPAPEAGGAHHFDLRRVARGLRQPTWVGAPPGSSRSLWALEQAGRVVRLVGSRRRTVLDLRRRVRFDGEQGLLGIAFHPRFRKNRRLYVHYTDRRGDTRVVEYRANRSRTKVRRRPVRQLLRVDQPRFPNHKGGQLAFGPDGRLYLGLGDGGAGNDPLRVAQNPSRRLGKLLSADVRPRKARWRVVLTGLRNPWRFSFDGSDVWIGDVGQEAWEEIDRVQLGADAPVTNLGWSAYEGMAPVVGGDTARPGALNWPVAVYSHDEANGCSVTGGVVYRGRRIAALRGRYLFGDYCSGVLWTLQPTADGRAGDLRREQARIGELTHIGTDARRELLLVSAGGSVYRAITP